MGANVWELGMEPKSSARAISALNHGGIFAAFVCRVLKLKFNEVSI